jgi:hypothetical protein
MGILKEKSLIYHLDFMLKHDLDFYSSMINYREDPKFFDKLFEIPVTYDRAKDDFERDPDYFKNMPDTHAMLVKKYGS